jgi:hypothetical protein
MQDDGIKRCGGVRYKLGAAQWGVVNEGKGERAQERVRERESERETHNERPSGMYRIARMPWCN